MDISRLLILFSSGAGLKVYEQRRSEIGGRVEYDDNDDDNDDDGEDDGEEMLIKVEMGTASLLHIWTSDVTGILPRCIHRVTATLLTSHNSAMCTFL